MKAPYIPLFELSNKIWPELPRCFRKLVVRYHEWENDPHSRSVLYDLFGENNIKTELDKLTPLFTILNKVDKFSDVNIFGEEFQKSVENTEEVVNKIYDICGKIPYDVDQLTHRNELTVTYTLMRFETYIEVYVFNDGSCEIFFIDNNEIGMRESCPFNEVGEAFNKVLNKYTNWLNNG